MVNLMGFSIFDGYKQEFVNNLIDKFKSGKKTIIISANPEVLFNAIKDNRITNLCKECDIIPDGIGVLIAGKIAGQTFKQKIAGIEVMEDILKLSHEEEINIYLLGAEDWVVEKTADICRNSFNSKIVGHHNGYFNMDDCEDILNDINKTRADVLFIAMGCPKQELFIAKYKDVLTPKVFMGVGGSFDVMAGKINRAPAWMINMGLEWLYRVIKEPYRIKRLAIIPIFLFKVMLDTQHKDNS